MIPRQRRILLTWDIHSKAKTLAKDITIANNLIYEVNGTSVIIHEGICNLIPTALFFSFFLNLKPNYCNGKSFTPLRDSVRPCLTKH